MSRVIVTGCSGAIGQALCQTLHSSGYQVVGLDVTDESPNSEIIYERVDLSTAGSPAFDVALNRLEELYGNDVFALINNAAVQVTGDFCTLGTEDFVRSINTNLLAPILLAKTFIPSLEQARGILINIETIHSRLTKPGFSAYSISKSGLSGLTRALSAEFGQKVRITGVAPAAISTEMLMDGFKGKEHLVRELSNCHPTGHIGSVADVANVVSWLLANDVSFLHGAIIDLAGGIQHVLNDPTN